MLKFSPCRLFRNVALLVVMAAALLVSQKSFSQPGQLDDATRKLSHDIFKQLVEINTTDSVGSVTAAAVAMEQRFVDAGFAKDDIYLGGPNDRKKNLVVRLHGSGAHRPILFIGHLDVVEARREDWTSDPFQFLEKDGYYYGRGTQDMKECDAIMVATFLRMKQEGYRPDRDLILALTADEEGGKSNGVQWLIQNHRELIDAAYVLNPDGGGVDLDHGKPLSMDVDATEKLYSDYQLTVTNKGGHSSLPVPDNAIYHLSNALVRLQGHEFPFELNTVTRAYFERLAARAVGEKAGDLRAMLQLAPDKAAVARLSAGSPFWNSLMHTTCVATRLMAGHANNALPQKAEAIVNCRILPGHSREEIRQELMATVADAQVVIRYVDNAGAVADVAPSEKQSPPAELDRHVMAAMDKQTAEFWPGAPVIPTMATGASDGIYTSAAGMPTYGISGIALEVSDARAHGRDERLPVESFYRGVDFYYQLIKMLTAEEPKH